MSAPMLQHDSKSIPVRAFHRADEPRGLLLPFDRAAAARNDRSASALPGAPTASQPFKGVDIEAALARVLASATFRQSRRHRHLLGYMVDATLDGRAGNLKEVVIGLDVFDRDLDGYDPHRDSIVRVEVRRLRQKLERYYDGEGNAETLEIVVPVGSYVPRFVARSMRPRAVKPILMLVLPFANLSQTSAAASLSAGLADQLIDCLGKQAGLQVMAPQAAQKLRTNTPSLETLRRVHGIDYVVDGSIACHGERIRCVAHLSRTGDRVRLWSGLFDFDASDDAARDVFAFQDRIADGLFAATATERIERTDKAAPR